MLGAIVFGNRVTSQFQYGVSTYLLNTDLRGRKGGRAGRQRMESGPVA